MKTLDIDSLDPGYSAEPTVLPPKGRKLSKRQAMQYRRTGYVSVNPHGPWHARLGVRPETMRDWRGLERRMFEIDSAWRAANEAFWRRARRFRRSSGPDGVAIVVISDPTSEDDFVLKLTAESYSHDNQKRLVESLLTDPHREGKFVLHGYDDGGRELGSLLRRESRLHRAYGSYKMAFERAVMDRLKAFSDTRRSESQRYYAYYSPVVVVVENEGRQYVFSMDNRGFFSRLEGDVFFNRQEIKSKT